MNAGPSSEPLHARRPPAGVARLVEQLVPDEQRRAERAAGVAGGRLDPDVLERPLAQDAAVADAVERDAAGQARGSSRPVSLVHVARHAQHDLFGHLLDRRGEVHLALRERRLGLRAAARRTARRTSPLVIVRPVAVVEVVACPCRNEPSSFRSIRLLEDALDVARLAVRREAHQLVLAAVDLEAGEVGERRVEQPERVREAQLAAAARCVLPRPTPIARRRPLADAVDA